MYQAPGAVKQGPSQCWLGQYTRVNQHADAGHQIEVGQQAEVGAMNGADILLHQLVELSSV